MGPIPSQQAAYHQSVTLSKVIKHMHVPYEQRVLILLDLVLGAQIDLGLQVRGSLTRKKGINPFTMWHTPMSCRSTLTSSSSAIMGLEQRSARPVCNIVDNLQGLQAAWHLGRWLERPR